MTDPSGAKFPKRIESPPVLEYGSLTVLITELSKIFELDIFSPKVFPVTVSHAKSRTPTLEISFSIADIPPALSTSSM